MSTNTPQTTQIMPTQSTLPIQPTSVGETPSGGGILQPTPVGPRATDKNYYRSLFGTISEPSTPPAPTINQNQSSHQIDSQNQQTNQNNLPNLATNNFPQFPNHINGNQFNQNNPQLNSVNSNNPQIAQINPNNPQFQPNNPQMNFNNPTNNVATNLNPISGGADFNFPLFTPNQVSAPAGAQAPFFQNMMMGNNGLNVQQAFPPAFMANNQVFTNTQTQPVAAQGFASNPNTNGFPASPAPVNASANIPVPSSNLPSAISPSSSNFNFPASPSSQNMVFPNSPPTKIASNPNANPISSVSLESFNFPPIVDDKNHLNSKSMNLSSQPASDLFNFPTFDSSTQIQPNPASSQSLFNPSGITNIGIGPSNPISSPTSSFGPLTPNILSSPSNPPPSSHPIGSPASSFGPLTPLLPSSTLPPPSSPSLPIGSSTSSFGQGNNILSPSLPSSLNGSSATLQSTSGPIDSMSGIGSGILSPLDGQLSSQHASFPTTPFNSAPPQASNQLTENLFSQLLPTMSTAKTTQSASLHSNSIEALQKMTQGGSLDGSGTGDLMQLFNKLIQAERYEEARDCKYQIECEKEIQLNLPLLQNAKFSGDLVKSLELREFIEKLQAKLVSQNQINSWRQPPSPDHKSFSQMQKEIEASAGKPRVRSFPHLSRSFSFPLVPFPFTFLASLPLQRSLQCLESFTIFLFLRSFFSQVLAPCCTFIYRMGRKD